MTPALSYFFLFAVGVLLFAAVEDIKYRGVTPLPLLILMIAAVLVSSEYVRDFYFIYFTLVLSLLLFVVALIRPIHARDGLPFIPEGDAWLLAGAVMACLDFMGVAIFLVGLALAELVFRLGLAFRIGWEGFTTRAPFGPSVLGGYLLMLLFRAYFKV